MRLPIGRLFGFDDQVVNAHLLDQGHHFLACARADREHRHYGRHAKNHPQHGQQRTQPVQQKILKPQLHVGEPLLVSAQQARGRSGGHGRHYGVSLLRQAQLHRE